MKEKTLGANILVGVFGQNVINREFDLLLSTRSDSEDEQDPTTRRSVGTGCLGS